MSRSASTTAPSTEEEEFQTAKLTPSPASRAWVSTNGTSWTPSVLATTYGGVGFSDGRFVLVGNRNIAGTDATASGWAVDASSPQSMYDRAAAAFAAETESAAGLSAER